MNILITGSRSGIANRVIDKLSKTNHTIYATTRTELQAKRLREKYKNHKNIYCFKLDVTNASDKEKLKEIKIDCLLSNAAVGYGGSVSEINLNRVRENFEVNVFNNLEIIQIVLKQMIERKKGKIIVMASLGGIIPISFLGSYCASKASLIKLTECLRKELKYLKNNIDIVLIEPGFYYTGFNQVMFENKEIKNSYFNEEIELIRKKESLMIKLLEKKNLDSIVNKIYKVILIDKPKFIYRAPLLQGIGAKIYQFFT